MEKVASAGATLSYTDLANRIAALKYAPNGSPFAELLSEISRQTHAKWGVLLSAVVVHRDDDLPGDGFFQLARELGHKVEDWARFHARVLRDVHQHYSPDT